jgi:hypothetical protein
MSASKLQTSQHFSEGNPQSAPDRNSRSGSFHAFGIQAAGTPEKHPGMMSHHMSHQSGRSFSEMHSSASPTTCGTENGNGGMEPHECWDHIAQLRLGLNENSAVQNGDQEMRSRHSLGMRHSLSQQLEAGENREISPLTYDEFQEEVDKTLEATDWSSYAMDTKGAVFTLVRGY